MVIWWIFFESLETSGFSMLKFDEITWIHTESKILMKFLSCVLKKLYINNRKIKSLRRMTILLCVNKINFIFLKIFYYISKLIKLSIFWFQRQTRFLQPLDIWANFPFKTHLKNKYLIDNNEVNPIKLKDNLSNSNDILRLNLIYLIFLIWEDADIIKPSIIIESFNRQLLHSL